MEIPKWVNDIFFNKKYRIWKHVAFWLFIYADELLSILGLTEPLEIPYWKIVIEILGDMSMIYLNIYYLIPRLFLKGKVVSYVFLTFLSICLVIIMNFFLFHGDIEEIYVLTYSVSTIVENAALLFMAVAMKLIQESYLSNTRIKELKEDKLKTELAYLRTQVNPHFLFNTLNNVYVMAKKQDEHLPETIMQLSDLLRYQLYDCDADTVQLKNEITYLQNYLKLEALRRQHLKVDFDVQGKTNSVAIRPLILLPFIENAFKYSNSGTGSDYIRMSINLEGHLLKVEIENNKGTLHQRDVGGIGLANARRRLELAYPDKHQLELIEDAERYLVKIEIDTL